MPPEFPHELKQKTSVGVVMLSKENADKLLTNETLPLVLGEVPEEV